MINKSVLAAVVLAVSTAIAAPAFAAQTHLYDFNPTWAPQSQSQGATSFRPTYVPGFGNIGSNGNEDE